MDDAHVLQRARRDLPVFDRRSARDISRTRALHRAALPSSRRNFHAHLHGRLALLRRESLARLPQHSAPNMTRRGSLIYYLAAWALGCFFMVLAVWCQNMILVSSRDLVRQATEGFLTLIVYGYLFGAPTALLFGLLLRRIMLALKCKTPLHWAVAGAILAPLVVVALGIGSRRAALVLPPEYASVLFPFVGSEAVLRVGWWLAIPAGATTAYYLGRIQRAFAPVADTTASAS